MLDGSINQAAGLQGLAPSPGMQLIAMVSHGDDAAELPLLWQLCSNLVSLSYPVTVLDGTSWEDSENAGLSQLLDHTYRTRPGTELQLPWNIIPSAWGLMEIDRDAAGLQRLENIFCQDDLVLIYAHAKTLASLLGRTGCTPLLVVSEDEKSLLTSYTALKRLILQGHLTPIIANMRPSRHSSAIQRQNHRVMNLLECAKNFLGYRGCVFEMAAFDSATRDTGDARRLALGLLETAVSLGLPAQTDTSTGTMGTLCSLRGH